VCVVGSGSGSNLVFFGGSFCAKSLEEDILCVDTSFKLATGNRWQTGRWGEPLALGKRWLAPSP